MGEQEPGEAAGGGDGAVAFGAALVEVSDQQVGAAGDLVQEVGDGDGRVVGPALAQVVAVGVDQGGPVAGGDAIGGRFGAAGVAFYGVQGDAQSAGTFE
ncbi:hypothetical protein OIE69_00720 [Actinacidiphila glaucinigra]|uniref:hypothetical protein n=1 Tax=Actinacidiphila glaucinigra TaxID=235986 RepID=UPI002DD9648B|nr:hypothetical protein [Actinacidiphila glaucinigra]WSD57573.1 hypothetical protein OIE69_00720 [Actinacidiphila glaucinigra]